MIVLHTESSPNFGGQELRIIHEITGLEKFGIKSILLCKKGSAIEKIAKKNGLKYFTTGFSSSIDPFSLYDINKIVKKYKVSVINSHSAYDSWCSLPVCVMNRIPFIRSRHIGLRLKNNPSTRYMYGRFAKKIVVTSKYIENQIKNICPYLSNIEIVPTGIDVEKFRLSDVFNLRVKYNIGQNSTIIAFISVLKSDKGPHILIEAFSRIIKQIHDVKLIIAGDGNFREYCKKKSEELDLNNNVLFLGHVENIYGLFKEIDIFVLPSIRPEGIPQSLLQAFAAKKPVIASDIGGLNEAAIHNETAYLVKPRDIDELTQAIMYVLKNPHYRMKISENAHNLLNEKFTLSIMLEKMRDIYKSVVND